MKITNTPTIEVLSSFATKFDIAQNGCWEWRSPQGSGYGHFYYNYGIDRAHRWFYQAFWGVKLDEKELCDHLCRNRRCVNPKHIDIVDNRTNVLRGSGHAAQNARMTHCKRGHEFSADNLVANKRGARICRTCEKARLKVRREQLKQEEAK